MKEYLAIMRPLHWIKNIFVFAGLVFGQKLSDPAAIGRSIAGFFCFCLAASAIYILNDIIDCRTDKLHPEKFQRPIAAGKVNTKTAAILAAICGIIAVLGSLILTPNFAIIIVSYIVLMILYSLFFKSMIILDCIIISVGFCLRAIAGAVVVGVFISPWLIICTFALCMFMSFGKRRGEIAMLAQNSESFRATLGGYSPELLAHMIDVTSGLAVVCFLLYAMDVRTMRIFGSNHLVYTAPLVLYCIFRFNALIQQGKYSGPVQLILKDLPFQIGFVIWILSCIIIIYK